MSTLWTPDGERPIRRDPPTTAPPSSSVTGAPFEAAPSEDLTEADAAELEAQMAELQARLAATPAADIVAEHAYGLFELARLHLSLQPPQLAQAATAIDAMACLVEGMAGRLGEGEATLADGLGQLRMAFVQIKAAAERGQGAFREGGAQDSGEHAG